MPLTNVTGKWIQVDFQNTLLRTFINWIIFFSATAISKNIQLLLLFFN
jgi:hypothetical protein